ncbi:hypothetical protein V7S43_006053 [Phytophthora oleae]|uniref:Uncharacterized protein n=1 Tax=Phytophthora oleae TaxID=2107226 RepID=A0ABD3FPW0_9STRA
MRVPLYRLELSDGSFIECSKCHHFYVRVKDNYVERTLETMATGDELDCAFMMPAISPAKMGLTIQIPGKLEIPFSSSMHIRLAWLNRQLDKNSKYMQITRDDKDWLVRVKMFAQTVATSPYIVDTCFGHHLRFSSEDVRADAAW